jgi:hypothetical protein
MHKENTTSMQKRYLHSHVYCGNITIAKTCNQSKYLSTDEWILKKCDLYMQNRVLFSHKEEWNPVTWNVVKWTELEDILKQKKSDSDRQVFHVFCYVETGRGSSRE